MATSAMAFHFPLMPRIFSALRREDRRPIADVITQTPATPPGCQWGLFLRNHDELTLETVDPEERRYLGDQYAAEPRMRANLGIRRRLAPLLEHDLNRYELATALLLSMPGSPVLYYGDEIGMGDNIALPDRDGVRTPMQWTGEENGGFSTAQPGRRLLPANEDPVHGVAVRCLKCFAQNLDRGGAAGVCSWHSAITGIRRLVVLPHEVPWRGHHHRGLAVDKDVQQMSSMTTTRVVFPQQNVVTLTSEQLPAKPNVGQARKIISQVDSPRLKLHYDLYHSLVMGEDPKEVLPGATDLVAHLQIAEHPEHHEPGSGDADWSRLVAELKDMGYRGALGLECGPSTSDPIVALAPYPWRCQGDRRAMTSLCDTASRGPYFAVPSLNPAKALSRRRV